MRVIIVMLFIVSSCSHPGKQKNNKEADPNVVVQDTAISNPDDIRLIPVQSSLIASDSQKINFIAAMLSKEMGKIEKADIKNVSLVGSKNISKMGKCTIYEIHLSNELPVVVRKTAFLIVNEKTEMGALFNLDSLVFVRTRARDSIFLLAGIQKVKGRGFFVLYDMRENTFFTEILNTVSICEGGMPVFNATFDCKSYNPFQLAIANIDIDSNGYLDLKFSGKIESFCEGFETDKGRLDKKPIHVGAINFSYLCNQLKNEEYQYTLKGDSTICDQRK